MEILSIVRLQIHYKKDLTFYMMSGKDSLLYELGTAEESVYTMHNI